MSFKLTYEVSKARRVVELLQFPGAPLSHKINAYHKYHIPLLFLRRGACKAGCLKDKHLIYQYLITHSYKYFLMQLKLKVLISVGETPYR